MYDEIQQKLALLGQKKPCSTRMSARLKEMDLEDWMFSCLRLAGSDISRESIRKILREEVVTEVSLAEYQKVYRCAETFKALQDMKEMHCDLMCGSGIRRLYQAVFDEEPHYRQSNPVLQKWDYLPPHCREIKAQMEALYRQAANRDFCRGQASGALQGAGDGRRACAWGEPPWNPLWQACLIHMRMLEIYPFGEASEEISRYAMLYEMLCVGFPAAAVSMSKQEYDTCIARYLKTGDLQPFYMSMLRSVYNKIEVMLQLLESGREEEEEG